MAKEFKELDEIPIYKDIKEIWNTFAEDRSQHFQDFEKTENIDGLFSGLKNKTPALMDMIKLEKLARMLGVDPTLQVQSLMLTQFLVGVRVGNALARKRADGIF